MGSEVMLGSTLALALSGLAQASSLFLVAAGLLLIFGVTRIVNFAHGSFYMLGAYLAVSLINIPQQIGLILVVFYVLQFVQSQLITPLLMGQEVNLPPAVILLSQIIAGIFFGFLGLLLSVPLAAIAVVLVREIYIKDVLGDTDTDVGGQKAERAAEPGPALSGPA